MVVAGVPPVVGAGTAVGAAGAVVTGSAVGVGGASVTMSAMCTSTTGGPPVRPAGRPRRTAPPAGHVDEVRQRPAVERDHPQTDARPATDDGPDARLPLADPVGRVLPDGPALEVGDPVDGQRRLRGRAGERQRRDGGGGRVAHYCTRPCGEGWGCGWGCSGWGCSWPGKTRSTTAMLTSTTCRPVMPWMRSITFCRTLLATS